MEKTLSEIFSSISVLLFFYGIALDLFQRDTMKFLEIESPDIAKMFEVKIYKGKYKKILFEGIIVMILSVSFLYILLPTIVMILKNSVFSFWKFEISRTLFILFFVILICFSFYTIYLLIKLINDFRKTSL